MLTVGLVMLSIDPGFGLKVRPILKLLSSFGVRLIVPDLTPVVV